MSNEPLVLIDQLLCVIFWMNGTREQRFWKKEAGNKILSYFLPTDNSENPLIKLCLWSYRWRFSLHVGR